MLPSRKNLWIPALKLPRALCVSSAPLRHSAAACGALAVHEVHSLGRVGTVCLAPRALPARCLPAPPATPDFELHVAGVLKPLFEVECQVLGLVVDPQPALQGPGGDKEDTLVWVAEVGPGTQGQVTAPGPGWQACASHLASAARIQPR